MFVYGKMLRSQRFHWGNGSRYFFLMVSLLSDTDNCWDQASQKSGTKRFNSSRYGSLKSAMCPNVQFKQMDNFSQQTNLLRSQRTFRITSRKSTVSHFPFRTSNTQVMKDHLNGKLLNVAINCKVETINTHLPVKLGGQYSYWFFYHSLVLLLFCFSVRWISVPLLSRKLRMFSRSSSAVH